MIAEAEENSQNGIFIKGAREHNLKNINVYIPRNKLVVVTGVSGSGKSSLTIDTLYAEGQRRYVESLSSYARQFLNRLNKPDVDYIKGICPAIALDQKITTRTTRSTVGTLTEIYDYLRLLYARVGKTFSPVSGEEVQKHQVSDVVDYCDTLPEGSRLYILVSLKTDTKKSIADVANIYLQKGFTRFLIGDEIVKIEDIIEDKDFAKQKKLNASLLIDRIIIKPGDEENQQRIADSAATAFYEGNGELILFLEDGESRKFSNRFQADGILFEEPSPNFFNQNNPFGACKRCEGFGTIIGVDSDLVIPDKSMSIYQGAIACWRSEKMSSWNEKLIRSATKFDFPIHKPINQLSQKQRDLLWEGNAYFWGLNEFFKMLEENAYKIQYRVLLARYRGRTACPECNGTRIRQDANYVKINSKSIGDLLVMPIEDLAQFFDTIQFTEYEQKLANRLLIEIKNRLQYMLDLGLGYLNLNRRSNTLSGGETQRINLTRTLGSNLTSSLYILDEPSVGLHPRDTGRLVRVLKQLRDLGNTVVVVEHEEEVIRSADHLIDIGPEAGVHGGNVVFAGNYADMNADSKGLTAAYLHGNMQIETPKKRRKLVNLLHLKYASMHNLKNISVTIPLHGLTVVTGVSGSGKTTLIKHVFYPELMKLMDNDSESTVLSMMLTGDWRKISQVEMIDQNPIGKSSRSNPVTYVKAYDSIRELYASLPGSKARGFKPSFFSFNVDGGRCEHCKGEGEIIVEMQFLADVHLQCEDCKGKRFKPEILEVKYKDKSIADVLEMSIEEAITFFKDHQEVATKMQPLADVGLGYVQLGQSSNTLSGGEAQRVKLASFLGKGRTKDHILFIFDEPTTGLHFHDIRKLLDAFNALIESGHSILVIEHNMEVIKCADWIIDLGPEGGEKGGYLLYEGKPEGLISIPESYTGKYLKEKL
ncbi:MAG: excinuclease ABC subunit UvrA [Chitinophagales bacterium]|nr:excinuclease ABC subunit UvrA [Chitinophagales bacterium]MBP9704497.1 excinuclease ABC subunit UvrA [Chitinophagales bacterium]